MLVRPLTILIFFRETVCVGWNTWLWLGYRILEDRLLSKFYFEICVEKVIQSIENKNNSFMFTDNNIKLNLSSLV